MSKLKVGVIGAGSISELHMGSYKNNPDVIMHAVCDLNEQRARALADKYGFARVYTNIAEMMADTELEAVSICTWNNTHADLAVAALNAGKHVLVEKPLSTTVEEALKVQEAVRRTGKQVQVGYVRRHGANTQMLKQFIDNGDFGEIYYAKASCLRRLGNPGGWFADKSRSGGGPLIDLGVHMIDLCWYLMGRPKVKSVSGNTYNKLGNRSNVKNLNFYKAADYDASKNTVEDMANAIVRFENGASLMVDVSFSLHAKENEVTVRLYGEKGGAEIEPEITIVTEKYDTILNVTPQVNSLKLNVTEAFQNQINHFVSCCLNGNTPDSSVDDGVEMMKILCGIYESAEQGKEIYF